MFNRQFRSGLVSKRFVRRFADRFSQAFPKAQFLVFGLVREVVVECLSIPFRRSCHNNRIARGQALKSRLLSSSQSVSHKRVCQCNPEVVWMIVLESTFRRNRSLLESLRRGHMFVIKERLNRFAILINPLRADETHITEDLC